MKTLKKTVCLLLCLMLVVLSASACKITEGQDEATGGETSRTDDATHSSGEPTTEQTTDQNFMRSGSLLGMPGRMSAGVSCSKSCR